LTTFTGVGIREPENIPASYSIRRHPLQSAAYRLISE
jgi:hypothetical protein